MLQEISKNGIFHSRILFEETNIRESYPVAKITRELFRWRHVKLVKVKSQVFVGQSSTKLREFRSPEH